MPGNGPSRPRNEQHQLDHRQVPGAPLTWHPRSARPLPGAHGSGRLFSGTLIAERSQRSDSGSSSNRGMTCIWGWRAPPWFQPLRSWNASTCRSGTAVTARDASSATLVSGWRVLHLPNKCTAPVLRVAETVRIPSSGGVRPVSRTPPERYLDTVCCIRGNNGSPPTYESAERPATVAAPGGARNTAFGRLSNIPGCMPIRQLTGPGNSPGP